MKLLHFPILFIIAAPALAEEIQFNRDIRPILSSRCFECHGPDEHERKGKLRLDQTGGQHGAYRVLKGSVAIKPGSVAESELWHRVTSDDPDTVMPPPEVKKKPLSKEEKELVRRWIEQGAAYQDYWAFVPPREPARPKVKNSEWSAQAIDQFVLRKLEAEGPPIPARSFGGLLSTLPGCRRPAKRSVSFWQTLHRMPTNAWSTGY